MEHRTWTTVDKSSWGDGPWQAEPDKEQFTDDATGLPCLIKRSHVSGALCGYVGIPEGHPWFGKADYDELDVSVHGDLTFADFCQEGPEEATICHIPGPGEPDRVYWLGFDCAHAWDLAPAMRARDELHALAWIDHDQTYRTVAFVKAQCAALAAQVAQASVPA